MKRRKTWIDYAVLSRSLYKNFLVFHPRTAIFDEQVGRISGPSEINLDWRQNQWEGESSEKRWIAQFVRITQIIVRPRGNQLLKKSILILVSGDEPSPPPQKKAKFQQCKATQGGKIRNATYGQFIFPLVQSAKQLRIPFLFETWYRWRLSKVEFGSLFDVWNNL